MRLYRALGIPLLALFVLAIGHSSQPAWAQSQQLAADSVLEAIKKRGTLKIGMTTFVPWAMRDKTGELIGFEIDVAKRLAADSEWKAEFVPTAWEGIIPALLGGKFDIIIGGMAVTSKRSLTINFSNPYASYGNQILASKKVAGHLKTLQDFNDPGVVFAGRRGSSNVDFIKKLFPKARIDRFDDDPTVLQELLTGRAHATLNVVPKPAFWELDHPNELFRPLGEETVFSDLAGFAVRKGDPDFLVYLNNWIRLQDKDGFLRERFAYWFGGRPWLDMMPAK